MSDTIFAWSYISEDGKTWVLKRHEIRVTPPNEDLWILFKRIIEDSGFYPDVYDYVDFILELSKIWDLPSNEQRKHIEELAEEIVMRNLSVPPHLQHHECNTQRRNRTLNRKA